MNFEPMHKILQPGKHGLFSLDHFEIKEASLRMMLRPSEYIAPGKYVRLLHGTECVMSDTQMEQRTNHHVLYKARGDVLIAGLGLGMVLLPILRKPEVCSVLVIEKHAEVIALVEAQLRRALKSHEARKFHVVHADIFDWVPPAGCQWDCIYFDIWNGICTDNLKQITKLKRRFARRKVPGGWLDAWVEDDLRYRKRRGD